MKRLNKKGFTLIELLAVIVILAVVMMIAATAIGPLTTRARQSAFATEGISAIESAKTAYQAEQLKPNSGVTATSSVCFNISDLKSMDYYTKGSGYADATNKTIDATHDGYIGSVLISYSNGTYSYKVWLSNGSFIINGHSAEELNADYETTAEAKSDSASTNCNNATGAKTCTVTTKDGKNSMRCN